MWQVVGQTMVVSLLKCSLKRKVVANAYLFLGPPRVGKMTLAINLAQALNCEATEPPCGECLSCQKIASAKHTDVQMIGLTTDGNSTEARSRAEISIDRIRRYYLITGYYISRAKADCCYVMIMPIRITF